MRPEEGRSSMDSTLEVRDLETGAKAWLIVRRATDRTVFAFALRPGGDVEVELTDLQLGELVDALQQAASAVREGPDESEREGSRAITSIRIKDVDQQETDLRIWGAAGRTRIQISLIPDGEHGIYDITLGARDSMGLIRQLEQAME
jgi:hypothetical protein